MADLPTEVAKLEALEAGLGSNASLDEFEAAALDFTTAMGAIVPPSMVLSRLYPSARIIDPDQYQQARIACARSVIDMARQFRYAQGE